MKIRKTTLALIAALLILSLCFTLIGCGKATKDDKANDKAKKTTSTTDQASATDNTEEKSTEEPTNTTQTKPDTSTDKKTDTNTKKPAQNTPQDVADEFMKCSYGNPDAEKFVSLFHYDTLYNICVIGGITVDDFQNNINDSFDSLATNYTDATFSWEIGKVTDLKDLEIDYDSIKQTYLDCSETEIEDLKTVAIHATITYTENGKKITDDSEIVPIVVLIDGKWYLDISTFS